jgi:hypothetical protein
MSPDSYAEVPYPTAPIRCTHPEILAVVGALFGLTPAPPERCRVLEIGCGDGGNLLPMAVRASRIGIRGHRAVRPAVERAAGAAESIGARNVRFEKRGVEELDAGWARSITSSPTASSRGSRPAAGEDPRRLAPAAAARRAGVRELQHVPRMARAGDDPRDDALPRAERAFSHGRVAGAREFLARLSDAVGATEKAGLSATDLAAFGSLLRHERDLLSRYPTPTSTTSISNG